MAVTTKAEIEYMLTICEAMTGPQSTAKWAAVYKELHRLARGPLRVALRELLERHEDSEFVAWLEKVGPNTVNAWRDGYAAARKDNDGNA